jgi:2-keto-4-pentenoate hydratase/2-oxohepta-3-ene-1,7-dioic acid hydratase in catechol pathway
MQQDGQPSRHCNNGAFLPALTATFGQLQTPAPVFLQAGDVVELGNEGLGESRQQVTDYK